MPSYEEKLEMILNHINLEIQEKGPQTGVKEMRKHIAWYVKNTKEASRIRDKINTINNPEELKSCLIEYFKTI